MYRAIFHCLVFLTIQVQNIGAGIPRIVRLSEYVPESTGSRWLEEDRKVRKRVITIVSGGSRTLIAHLVSSAGGIEEGGSGRGRGG